MTARSREWDAPRPSDGPDGTPDRRLTRLALGLVTLVVAALLTASGAATPLQTAGAVGGPLLLGWAGGAVECSDHRRRALGGLAASVGAVGLLAGVNPAAYPVHTLLGSLVVLATGFAGTDDALGVTLTSHGADTEGDVFAVPLVDRLLGLARVAILGLLLWIPIRLGLASLAVGGVLQVATSRALAGLVVLQVTLVGISMLLPKAATRLERAGLTGPLPTVRQFGIRPTAVPRWAWLGLGVELFLTLPGFTGWFDGFLGLLGPAGTLFAAVVTSPVLHGATLLAFGSLATFVLLWDGAKRLSATVGDDAPRLLADSVGPAIVVALAALLPAGQVLGAPFDSTGVVLVGLVAVAAAVVVVLAALRTVRHLRAHYGVGSVYATSSLGLLALCVAAAALGAGALPVFVGVAVSLLLVDLGETARSVGEELGSLADSADLVATRTAVPLVVAGGAVCLALGVTFLLGPLAVTAWQATVGVGGALLSLVGYLMLGRE